MSKAEERALEKYPKKIEWVGNQWDGSPFDVNSEKRFGYQQGYHQAEKDNELTWEDIELIVNIDKDTDNEESIIGVRKNEEHYQEVLKRFKAQKREEV